MDKKEVVKLALNVVELTSILGLAGCGLYACWQWREAENRCEKMAMCADAVQMVTNESLDMCKKLLNENEQLKAELKKKEEVQTKTEQKVEEA